MIKFISLFKYTKKYAIYAILCPLFMIGEAVLELQVPNRIGKVIDYLTECKDAGISADLNQIMYLGLIILGFSFLSLIFGILGGVFASVAASAFSTNLKRAIFNNIQTFSFASIDKYSTSSLITRLTTDTNWVQMSFQLTIRLLFRAPAIFVYAIIRANQASPDLSFLFFLAIPIILVGLGIIFAFSHPLFERGIKKIDVLNQVVEENVRGIRVIKSFTKEKSEIKKFDNINDELYRTFKRAHNISNLNNPLMNLVMFALLLLIAYLGSNLIVSGSLSKGALFELTTYSTQILTSLMMISMIFVMFLISKPSRDRVYEVLSEVSTIRNPLNPIEEVKDGSIEFINATFKYSDTSELNVLNNINLKINSGDTIGIIGTTGSSKTTLISLIARLYDVKSGEVKVGKENVKDYDLKALRDAVSVVLQNNVLFSGTIKENLRWGNKDATDDEIILAAKIAQAHDFIQSFPDGYDTYIEQGGKNVSGGQKQRICIARALLKNPKILILDDSMSAVDTKTDKLIRMGLKEYRKDITKIIVAQRCQSVMDADKIIIIDSGEIIDSGSHSELLKTSPIYQEIYYSQNKEEVEEDA